VSFATATAAAAVAGHRRPGFAFEAVAPAAADPLPRMDVPLLAGIAARGPLHVPVAVEDLAQFEARFGGPAPLVLDAARGETVRAQLHGAVALFFANGGQRCWVLRVAHPEPLAEASRYTLPGVQALRVDERGAASLGPLQLRAPSPGRWADGLEVATSLEVDRAVALSLSLESLSVQRGGADEWVAGDLLRLSWPSLTAHVAVAAVERPPAGAAGPVVLRLRGPWWVADEGSPLVASRLATLPVGLPMVECLRLTLWWRDGVQTLRLAGLGLAPGHARHVARLPDDVALFARPDAHVGATPDAAALARRTWADAMQPRLPVAGFDADAEAWCLPLGVAALPQAWAAAVHSGRAPIERDGLVPWSATLFADPALVNSSAATLAADADGVRVLSRQPRALSGLHAAWSIEEISMLAVPDAGWPGWALQSPPPAPPPPVLPPVVATPPGFGRCEPEPIPLPEAPPPAPAPALQWLLQPAPSSLAGRATLLAVQRLMLRWVQARADAVALLSLPAGAGAAEALAHRSRLLQASLPVDDGVPALLGTEHAALALAAQYHGGVLRRTADGVLQREGADGAVAGLIARRTRERGAWIAPANEALRGIVALSDAATEGAMGALLDARVNLLAATPRGLMPLNADTLGAGNAPGAGDDLRALAARRLLQLLRRLALREGQAWVFEPHDGAFRRGVQRSLEAILRGLFERGAFAGRRAEDSFQVVAESEGLNTRASADAGRFVVELRVAPARPMAFVTVRLVRSGDGLALE